MREGTTTKRGAIEMKMLIVDDKEGNLYMLEAHGAHKFFRY